MAREKGSMVLPSNIELGTDAPLDARTVVETKADLTVAANFEHPYEGLPVYVAAEKKYYVLTALPVTSAANWKALEGGGGGTPEWDDILNKPDDLVEDADYVHTDNNYTNADKAKLDTVNTTLDVNVTQHTSAYETVDASFTNGSDTVDIYYARNPEEGEIMMGSLSLNVNGDDSFPIATKWDISLLEDGKQDKLTAGQNISIVKDTQTGETTISATGGGGTERRFQITFESTSHDDGVTFFENAALDGATYQDLYDAVKAGENVILELTTEMTATVELRLTLRQGMDKIEDSALGFHSAYNWLAGDICESFQATFNYYETTVTGTQFANAYDLRLYAEQLIGNIEKVPLSEVKSWFPPDPDTEVACYGSQSDKTSGYIKLYADAAMTERMHVNRLSSESYNGKALRLFIDGTEAELENVPTLIAMGPMQFNYYTFSGKWNGENRTFRIGAADEIPSGSGSFFTGIVMN